MELTAKQRELVEQNLELVPKTISLFITTHNDITGMEYDDLYQTGCLALCDAIQSYCPDKNASLSTYAVIVIRNRLYDYCRHVNCIQSRLLYLDSSSGDDGYGSFLDSMAAEQPKDITTDHLLTLLLTVREEWNGIAAKGIDALLLKTSGYTSNEIAHIYRVKPNHVSAWISRANKRLRQEPRVLSVLRV